MPDDDLLSSLRAAGALEFRGAFTVDPRALTEKLREYQLEDPRHYVLRLVQAAVRGGAESLHIASTAWGISYTFKAWSIPEEWLENPLLGLSLPQDGTARESWRELAVALNSALALHPGSIEVVSGRMQVHLFDAGRVEVKNQFHGANDGPGRRLVMVAAQRLLAAESASSAVDLAQPLLDCPVLQWADREPASLRTILKEAAAGSDRALLVPDPYLMEPLNLMTRGTLTLVP